MLKAGGNCKTPGDVRLRVSIRELEQSEVKLNAFLRAYKRVQELPPDNPDSFWVIAGYHGLPFVNNQFELPPNTPTWGGWCQHGNVLFPTWHRAYCLRLENALRAVSPDDDVTLPYWDATSEESLQHGLPEIVTKEKVMIDGQVERNPLHSYVLPKDLGYPMQRYYKPAGYSTVRYPYSGIRAQGPWMASADEQNATVDGYLQETNNEAGQLLNGNILDWLGRPGASSTKASTAEKIAQCLQAPTYNIFSNTSSAEDPTLSLESAHNDLHLAVGGFTEDELPPQAFQPKEGVINPILPTETPDDVRLGANGDMGENETASFDPAFFLHHCNIDRLFWIWQKNHGFESDLVITEDEDDKGTLADFGQNLSPHQKPGERLNMDSPLVPFQKPDGSWMTSRDVVNIETQLGYNYSVGSHDHIGDAPAPRPIAKPHRERVLVVSNINKASYAGSFVIRAYYVEKDGGKVLFGREAILARWDMKPCHNCQLHLDITVRFSLKLVPESVTDLDDFRVEVTYRDSEDGRRRIQVISHDRETETGPRMELKKITVTY